MDRERAECIESFAVLLDYPGCLTSLEIERATARIALAGSDVAPLLASFRSFMVAYRPEELEEIYTTTFDGNAECALEVGWHLYGEAYQRGVFLVQMRDRLKRLGIEESSELPDHLTLVLRSVVRAPDDEASALVRRAVLPALAKLREGLAARSSAYLALLSALALVLEQEFGAAVPLATPPATAAAPGGFGYGCGGGAP